MEFIYDCLVVARTYYGAFYLKPVYNRSWRCVCTSDRWRNLVEGCENGAGNRRKYDTRKHLEDACTGVTPPKTSKRMQVDVIRPLKGSVVIREFRPIQEESPLAVWLNTSRWNRTAKSPKGHSIPTWLVLPGIWVECITNKPWLRTLKYALWLQYIFIIFAKACQVACFPY